MLDFLPIFDIDGTLTRSTGVDDECFVAAVEQALACRVPDTNWANYDHSTDDGLVWEISKRYAGRALSPEDFDRIKLDFLASLRAEIGDSAARCEAAPGIRELLALLRARAASPASLAPFAIASGAWEESARLKLQAAAIDVSGAPGAFSFRRPDDTPAYRVDIISKALDSWMRLHGRGGQAHRIVYIGDGLWDARAARELGIGFIGVRLARDTAYFRAEFPDAPVLTDFHNAERIIDHMSRTARPFHRADAFKCG